MCAVSPTRFAELLINASAVGECLEVLLIGAFVGGQVALGALDVSSCLLESVLVSGLWVLLLCLK